MQITVGTDPVRLDDPNVSSPENIAIRNASGTILLGASNVTSATSASTDGWPYTADDDPMTFRAHPAGLWAVVASGTETIEVLRY